MTINVTCDCGKTYQLSDDMAGKRGKCKECGNSIEIPSGENISAAPVPSIAANAGMQESLNSWDDVRTFILSEFSGSVQDEDVNSVTVVKYWDNDRGQMVVIRSIMSESGSPWISIISPVGILPAEILPRVCELLNENVCGALIKLGDRYWIRHSMPVGNTSKDEVLFPLDVVAWAADDLEMTFVGGDAQ